MLRTEPRQGADELAKRTLEGLKATLEGIATRSVPRGFKLQRARAPRHAIANSGSSRLLSR
jgi:hypothetical protein